MKASTVLRRVLKLFENGRWTQGDWNEKQGGFEARREGREDRTIGFGFALVARGVS